MFPHKKTSLDMLKTIKTVTLSSEILFIINVSVNIQQHSACCCSVVFPGMGHK